MMNNSGKNNLPDLGMAGLPSVLPSDYQQTITALRAENERLREDAENEWKTYPESKPEHDIQYLVQTWSNKYFMVYGKDFEFFEKDTEQILHFQEPCAPLPK